MPASRGPTARRDSPRVLVIPASYFARDRTVGGGERYALEYARALAELTPTTMGLLDRVPARAADGALEVRTFGVRSLRQRWGVRFTAESWRALGAFDVLHLMVFPTPLTDTLILSARLRGQTVVLTDVGGGAPCLSTYLKRLSGVDLHRLAHGLAPLSRHADRFFAGWPHARAILYGGADGFAAPEADAEPGGYALFVGRLLPHKGVLELIQALQDDTPLHVVGRPYDAAYLERLRAAAAGKRVTFVLDADDARLRREYAGASVVLQPSIPVADGAVDTSELLGLVALEAMAAAKPVVVTATASLPELVVDGETGFVVPPLDPGALRDRVARLVGDPALSRRMGERARARVRETFTWRSTAERGLALYRALRPAA